MKAPEKHAPEGASKLARVVVITCLMAGTLMQALDATVANVALPYMQGSLSASREQITWVLTSYVIATAVATAPVGWLAARFGRKNCYIVSLVGFTVASILCGASQTLEQIVICRLVQGVFGAALVPLSQSMMYDLYPPDRRAQAMALYGSGVMLGPILGPTIGGFVTDQLSWRWVFYINVPFGIAAVAGLLLFPSKGIRNPGLRFDWTGFGLVVMALCSLQLMLDRGTDKGWFESPEIIVEGVCAVLGFYLFAVHLATAETPFIPRRLLNDRSFIISCGGYLILGQVVNASLAALPPFLQSLSGYSVLYTGLIMSPRGFGTVAAMQCVGPLSERIGMRAILIIGATMSGISMWIMGHWTPNIGVTPLILVSMMQGFGTGLLFLPLNLVAFSTVPTELRTDAAGILALVRNLGGAIGISISTSFIASQMQIIRSDLAQHASPFNRALQMNAPGMFWNTAMPMTAQSLNGVIERQAQIIAYADNFLLLGLTGLAVLGAALAIGRTPSPRAAEPPAAME